jgi:hypothetical protein
MDPTWSIGIGTCPVNTIKISCAQRCEGEDHSWSNGDFVEYVW